VKRGRLYVCGFLSLIRVGCSLAESSEGQTNVGAFKVRVSRWTERNIRWWLNFFEECEEPLDFLLPRATFQGDVQGDASGTGFGALIIVGTTCFYFHGLWTTAEKALLQGGQTLNINYTECLTQLWMLLLFGEHIAGHQVILECDNLWTVQALHEHRARKLAGAILLEKIDTAAALIYCEPFWQHLAGVYNRASDELSRFGDTVKFRRIIQSTYLNSDRSPTITSFVDITASLTPQMRNSDWLSSAVCQEAQ
jgi:hypothetical protein